MKFKPIFSLSMMLWLAVSTPLAASVTTSSTIQFSQDDTSTNGPRRATAKESYDTACEKAASLLEQWKLDSECITSLRTTYNTLKTTYSNYGPEAIDTSDDAAMKTATTKLNSACNSLTNKAESTKNESVKVTKSKFDPNFHIYLCFGQSNMEGNATPELQDYSGSSKRFLTMAAVSMNSPSRTKGSWYVARPPLCRQGNGLTPADYFGKTMAKNLPDSITVGVINVALGGCSIKMFMEDQLATYLPTCEDWLKNYAKNYGDNPYRWLINCAKQAQKVGVIKGILLHQGCSDNMQSDWPTKVNTIYQRMLRDLNLNQCDCPLLVGELLENGACSGHNQVIAKVPSVIDNSWVVSSKGCPGASDRLHFTAEGYRMIGTNYANVMLKTLQRYSKDNNKYTIKSLAPKETAINMTASSLHPLYMQLTDASGTKHDVTGACEYSLSEEGIVTIDGTNVVSGMDEGDVTVTATFTNDEGVSVSTDFKISTGLFLLKKDAFNPSILKTGTASFTTSSGTRVKSSKGGLAGWVYPQSIDLSAYRYIKAYLKTVSTAKPSIRIYSSNDPESTSYYSASMEGLTEVTVDLQDMKDDNGKTIDPKQIYIIGFTPQNDNAFVLNGVEAISAEGDAIQSISLDEMESPSAGIYDLTGRRISSPKHGIFITNGRKIAK